MEPKERDSIDLSILRHYCYRCRDQKLIRQVQRRYAIPRRIQYLLCAGDYPDQNLVFAVQGFADFMCRYAVQDLFFVVGGPCSGEQMDLLQYRIERLPDVQYHLVRIGPIDQADLAPLMGGAFGFVHATRCSDDSLPILEAMACGCPVIYSDIPIFSSLVGSAGIPIRPGNNTDLSEAYHRLYADKKFRQACIRQGLKRAEKLITLSGQGE